MLCLPVDMLIFYLEPLGPLGTLIAMVLAFIPFSIIIADAIYPEKDVIVTLGDGRIFRQKHKNSWYVFYFKPGIDTNQLELFQQETKTLFDTSS